MYPRGNPGPTASSSVGPVAAGERPSRLREGRFVVDALGAAGYKHHMSSHLVTAVLWRIKRTAHSAVETGVVRTSP